MKIQNKNQFGFTLIELMAVISIVALLGSVILVALNQARLKGRDGKRIADLKQLVTALDLYYDQKGKYPDPTDSSDLTVYDPTTFNCSGWSISGNNNLNFLKPLVDQGIIKQIPKDPTNTGGCAYNSSSNNFFARLLAKTVFAAVGPPPTYPAGLTYAYTYFTAGSNGCDPARGNYYVLGIKTFESIPAGSSYQGNPAFSCPGYNWQSSSPNFQWVTGKFER